MKAQEIIEEVEREMQRKYDPEQQVCEYIKKLNPEFQDSPETHLEAHTGDISGIEWLEGDKSETDNNL